MKPFSDLACELIDGMPECPDEHCGCPSLDPMPGLRCALCAGGLCLVGVGRIAQVFEAARSTAASQTEPMTSAMLLALEAVNANVEGE